MQITANKTRKPYNRQRLPSIGFNGEGLELFSAANCLAVALVSHLAVCFI